MKLSLHVIIRRFLGNLHVMHMRFAHARRGNFHADGIFVHFGY